MYKTIRHGENSLQYTILPQNDDYRVEGSRLTGSGSKESSRISTRRNRRKSCFAYFGLVFVCTVIVGAILVPLLVSTDYLPTPSTWFLQKKAAIEAVMHGSTTIIGGTNQTAVNQSANAVNRATTATSMLSTTTVITTESSSIGLNLLASMFKTKIRNSTNDKILPKTTDKLAAKGLNAGYNEVNSHNSLMDSFGTISTNNDVAGKDVQQIESTAVATATAVTTGAGDDSLLVTPNFIHVTKSSRKPVTYPVLAKTNTVLMENGKLRTSKNDTASWIKTHWPFVDPSSYLQWINYRSEDSVLLPAILGAALIGLILIITLCLVARNKRTIVSTMKKRNRNTNKENGEVNATLLTNSNLSEEE